MKRLTIALVLLLGCSAGASQGAPEGSPVTTHGLSSAYEPASVHPALPGASLGVPAHLPLAAGGTHAVPESIRPIAALAARSGVWAYAKPSHGPGYLAIPEGPGWIVLVCGPLQCFEAVSTDAGPELWLQKPPHSRIGDLSAVMFRRACGSLSAGLCRGSYEILGAADQHPDDPPADPRDDAMRDEVGDELYTLPPTDSQGGPG